MARITMETGPCTVASLELGAASEPDGPGVGVGYFDAGDLAVFGGNLYLFVDGEEIGSLFFHTVDGKLRVELGQFDPDEQDWVARNPLGSVKELPGGEQMLAGLAPVGE